ncbi:uncharacterized protein LOC120772331 isoform X2 [Bactrocera tryoni]|uniref:uncharacterized protein LOC120772331 isoform X2 n=1 Tax=Bactrocera tryoni TaxID=59916 RepID=UPI001A95B3D7|nr:uncharacterized protein LOC120772331 isoform X2 [Bactrocera tryoni]
MDKSILNQFTSYVEQLRNTECSQKEKITYFQHISECIMSPGLAGHINYATHINTATTVLLLFCEDLDPVVRMNAEENLNRIFRALEKTRVSRILMDLYGEIKRNGNQRSLRICLNLFAYYAPQIRERNIKWYAVRLLPCLQTIAQRKETQLCETLCEFVKNFGKYLQMGLTDSESCKLFEAFMANIGVECAVKRRCSAQNCISLIENSRNKSLMAKHGLSKAFEFLLADQQQHNVVGVLGFLRLLLPLIIHGFSSDCPDDCDDGHSTQAHAGVNKGRANTRPTPTKTGAGAGAGGAHTTQATATTTTTTTTAMPINTECRQIIEIFDYCLHLLNISSASQHSIINAALEVINAVLQALEAAAAAGNNNGHQGNGNSNGNNNDILKWLQAALCNQQLQHAEYLRRRKSLKNQIFQLRNYEAAAAATVVVSTPAWQQRRGVASDFHELTGKDVECEDEGEASESMSKLFRPSSVVRATPTKSVPPTASDKSDVVSTASAATSTAPADSISLISTASSGNKALDSGNSVAADPQSDSVHTYTHSIASSSLGMHDDTVSTALLVDTSLQSVSEYDTERAPAQAEPMGRERRVPNANPFLSDKTSMEQSALGQQSQLTLKIGTPFEQSIVRYTARLIAARFLLAGQAGVLLHDTQIRISIKSLSLSVLAHCVRFDPEVLQLPLEITARELLDISKQSPALGASAVIPSSSKSSSASGSPQSDDNVSGSSSNLGKDYEHLDAVDFIKSSSTQPTVATAAATLNDLPAELQLLEIKDDHFGKSTCDYLLHSTTELSKSADPVLMSQQMRGTPGKPATKHIQQPLSKSEIIATKTSQKQPPQRSPNQSQSSPYRVTESMEDAPPQMLPPRPPKRTKSQRKSIAAATTTVTALMQIDEHFSRRPAPDAPSQQPQQVTDALLYYNHSDPMLRGGVQQIIGGFFQAMGVKDLGASLQLNVQHLLAMLVKGLQDDIHTVVIQALNAFEKIFPYVVSKYLILPAAHHQHKQQKLQQQQTHTGSAESTAAEAAEAVDKSGRKCHANAAGQVPQQQEQQRTNDATKSGFYTHVDSSSKSPANATAAKTCPRTLFNDNDALIAALLNDFQLQSKSNRNGNNSNNDNTNDQHTNDTATQPQTAAVAGSSSSSSNTTDPLAQPLPLPLAALRISPKLLLSKLRLCHYNKYWLVQNKYAEVISNLNYAALHAACNDCHGHCCGTAIGCACDIGGDGGAEVLEDVGAFAVSGCCDVFVADNNTVNATLPGGGGAATAYACGEDMSYKDLDDSVCIYESQFLDELLQLIGNDDFRVRENAALCLCRFIMRNAKHKQQQLYSNNPTCNSSNKIENSGVAPFGFGFDVAAGNAAGAVASGDDKSLSPATYETNFNLLWDFFDYRLFSGLPLPLRNLFRATSTPTLPATTTATEVTTAAAALSLHSNGDFYGALPQRHRAEEEKLLAKVLYRMTNKLMELEDKNAQFGIIYTLKMLLQDFNFIDYQRAWTEFNFIEICQRFSYHNYATAVDLACQNDLIDVTGKLMAGYMLASTLTVDQPERSLQLQLDQLLVHVMKILNIYYHLITQQKPQLFVKVQKSDLFANAKELALVQSVGYFGSDYIYIKLYNILRSANDSYKITINQESGRLLISLLRTCLNTLGLCIELRAHTAPTPTPAGTPTGHTPSHGRQRGHSPGSSGADTASNTGAGGGGSSSATAVFPTNATLKLIEEILQYLSKLVNYAPGECIACLRQLLKYLFGQNYGNQQRDYYATFIRPYFVVRSKGQQLQLHLQQQQQQQRSPQKQQKWPTHNKQQQQHAQQGSSRRGSNSSKFTQASGDHQQAMTMLHAINSAAATTLASTATAGGVLRSMATTSDDSTSALKGAAGIGLSTPTMTTSTVRHNEPNVIGAQAKATYANRGQALIDSGHASGVVSVAAVAAGGNDHNQPHLSATEYYRLMGELFASGLNLQAAKSERAGDCVKHIKLFEPLVIYCLMLFLKSNARVQAPILELLSQLLELNVTYSVLDSKNVIFDQILNNLDLIEKWHRQKWPGHHSAND